jgi:hypothetical protein
MILEPLIADDVTSSALDLPSELTDKRGFRSRPGLRWFHRQGCRQQRRPLHTTQRVCRRRLQYRFSQ